VDVRGATWDDLEAAADLLAAQQRSATGVGSARVELLRAEWELLSFDVGRDNWIVEGSGYAALTPPGTLVLAAADPAVADALLQLAIERGRERGLAALHLTVLSGDVQLDALVRRHRFALERDTLVMWRLLGRGIAEPVWPEDIAVRTFAQNDAAPVYELLDEAYRGWDSRYVPIGHEDWVQLMTEDVEFDPSAWWLAECEGELAGCALYWSSGWLKDLAVRPSRRGRGLGRALVLQGLREFDRRGLLRVGLKVDADNPTGAPELYRRLGFDIEQREAIWSFSL
jgi:ribosomal protein S18 acetylase RimI-like enzyme